jgi:predicted transcriptional regulator
MTDGTTSVPVSLRMPADVIEKLDKVAGFYERPRSWVMLRALRQYLAEEGQEALDCLESIAELDRGEYYTLDEVMAEMDEKISELKGKRAAE